MALTIAGIPFLIGAALGLRFNVLCVILTISVALPGTVFIGIVHGDRIGSVVLTTVLAASAVQIGYFAALVTRAAFTSMRAPNVEATRTLAYAGEHHSFSMFKSLDVHDHMEVVGSDGEHVGMVDHKETADRIILTKDDPKAGGRPHLISIKWVDYVDDKIHLNKPSRKAMREWLVTA